MEKKIVVKAGRVVCRVCLEPVGILNDCRTVRCPHNPQTSKGPRLL
jgi:hypothetical protein